MAENTERERGSERERHREKEKPREEGRETKKQRWERWKESMKSQLFVRTLAARICFPTLSTLLIYVCSHTHSYTRGKLKEKASKTVENFLIYRLNFDAEATAALAPEKNIIMMKNKCHKKHMKDENMLKYSWILLLEEGIFILYRRRWYLSTHKVCNIQIGRNSSE